MGSAPQREGVQGASGGLPPYVGNGRVAAAVFPVPGDWPPSRGMNSRASLARAKGIG
jgi:hypothetical protein